MVDAYIWVPHIHSTLSYSWQPLPLACECFRSNSRQWNVRQCLLKSFWKDFPILSKQNSMKWKIKFFLPLLPSSEAAVLRSCYTPFQDYSIHIPGYTYVQKQTYWRTSDLWKKKKKSWSIASLSCLEPFSGFLLFRDKKSKTSNPVLKAMCDLVHASLSTLFLGHTSCLTHHASTTLALSKFFKWAWSLLSQRLCICYSLCLNDHLTFLH